MEIRMKTYTVVVSYFDENNYYVHYYMATYIDHEKAQKFAKNICRDFNASEVVECTLNEHLTDQAPFDDTDRTKSKIKIIIQDQ